MARHTFVCSAGRRIDIQPCKFSPGLIRLQILSANKEILGSCTFEPGIAGVIVQALELEGAAAETASDASCEARSANTDWARGPVDPADLLSMESKRVIETARVDAMCAKAKDLAQKDFARQLDKMRNHDGVSL